MEGTSEYMHSTRTPSTGSFHGTRRTDRHNPLVLTSMWASRWWIRTATTNNHSHSHCQSTVILAAVQFLLSKMLARMSPNLFTRYIHAYTLLSSLGACICTPLRNLRRQLVHTYLWEYCSTHTHTHWQHACCFLAELVDTATYITWCSLRHVLVVLRHRIAAQLWRSSAWFYFLLLLFFGKGSDFKILTSKHNIRQ